LTSLMRINIKIVGISYNLEGREYIHANTNIINNPAGGAACT